MDSLKDKAKSRVESVLKDTLDFDALLENPEAHIAEVEDAVKEAMLGEIVEAVKLGQEYAENAIRSNR